MLDTRTARSESGRSSWSHLSEGEVGGVLGHMCRKGRVLIREDFKPSATKVESEKVGPIGNFERHSPVIDRFDKLPVDSNNSPPKGRVITLISSVLLCLLVFGSQPGRAASPPAGVAPVNSPTGGFGIEGDLFANMPAANVGDWITNSLTGGGVLTRSGAPINASTTFHFIDQYDGNDLMFGGGLKWTDNPTNWSWTIGKANGKTDINNVLLHTATDANDHSWIAIAADRLSTSGDSYIDFEFLQNTLVRTNNGAFLSAGPHGGRTTNDLLLSLAFTSGGSVADFFAWRWQPNGSGGFAYVDVTASLPVGRAFVALNTADSFVPYGAFGSTNYAPNAFAEAALDLTALLGNFDPCLTFGVKTLMVKTKTSQSSSASIEDLMDPIQLTLRIGPSADAGPDQTRCREGDSTLFALSVAAGAGLQPIVSTTWSVVSGTATIDSTNSLTTSAHVSSATATLRLTVLQANGCTETDDIVLTVASAPACSITGPSSVCPQSTRQFSGPAGMNSYSWSATGNAAIFGPTNQQTVSILAGNVCGEDFSLFLNVISNLCSSACTREVMVNDTTAPSLACPVDLVLECPADTRTNVTGVATAQDDCGLVTVSFSDTTTDGCGGTKVIARTWTAADACGNSTNSVQTITVRDTTRPTILCVPDKTVECTSTWDFDAPTASDTCGSATITILSTVTNITGHCGNTFDTTRTWRATDACGNTAECSQKVTVQDTTKPTITCAGNKTVECTSTWDFDPPPASDTCGNVTITVLNTVTNTAGHCGNTFDTTRTWRATDACGNTADCSQTVTVEDHTPPTITCVPDKTVECISTWDFDPPIAADGCGTATISIVSTVTNLTGHCGNTFDATRTWRATDACGNTAECSQKVTLEDHTPPTITCVANKSVECGSDWTFDAPTASDTCGDVTIAILGTVTNTDALVQGQYDLKFYVADPDSGTGPYAPTYLQFAPGSLPCPADAGLNGRALDPLRNAVAYAPSGQLDALTSIGNVPMAFGQIVPYEVVIQASGGPGPERGTIEFTAAWSTYTTSNNRFGYDTNYMVYCAFVDAADPGSIDPNNNARVQSYSSVVINPGTIAERIQGTFRISGLDDGDRVVVEIWVVLDPATSGHAGSNVAADLVSAQKLSDPPVPITLGAQTDSLSVSKIGELPPPQEQPPLGPLPPQPPALPGETISGIDR